MPESLQTQEQIAALTAKVASLSRQVDSFYNSSDMSLEFERTLRLRLGIEAFRGMISGSIAMSSGSATITDPKITTTSQIIVTNQTSRGTQSTSQSMLGAVCTAGVATISESSGVCSDTINYLILY